MSKLKGTDIVILKKILQEKGADFENAFLQKLDPEIADLYQNLMHTTWAPVEKMVKLYEALADTFFPNDPLRLLKLGKYAGERSFTTVYKIFLRNHDLDSVLNRIGMIWNAYHVKGKVIAKKGIEGSVDIIVSDYPELPRNVRMIINGHFTVLLELIGLKNITIVNHDMDPNHWRWHVAWEVKTMRTSIT
jgi:hypothetical protein